MSSPTISPTVGVNATANANATGGSLLRSVVASPVWPVLARAGWTVLVALVSLLATLVYWIGFYLIRAVVWLFNVLAAWPLSRIWGVARFLLSPITYTLSYLVAPLVTIYHFLGQFRPLYTYLGSAAFIGVVTGLAIKLASEYVVVVLRISRKDERGVGLHKPRPIAVFPPARLNAASAKASVASRDDVWKWLDEYKPKKVALVPESSLSPSTPTTPKAGGLQSTSILEESSTE